MLTPCPLHSCSALATTMLSDCDSSNGPDLTGAAIVAREDSELETERTAIKVLVDEIRKRTGTEPRLVSSRPETGAAVSLSVENQPQGKGEFGGPESYAIATDLKEPERPLVRITATDGAGLIFGVGRLLRNLDWGPGRLGLVQPLNVRTSPEYGLRGHQLGYRATANSYDAWDVGQYEQHIRELAFFGANAVENIPLQDSDSPVMKVPRDVMNREMSAICRRYGMQYWMWAPVTDLSKAGNADRHMKRIQSVLADTPHLTAIFIPGGDPGDNPPELLLPYLEEMSRRLADSHPDALIWLSLQGFNEERTSNAFDWIARFQPDWFGGIVHGPSSPPLELTRERLPQRYRIRHYPDITHTVRSQYPVPWIDPAFAFTLGREPVNPMPEYYTLIHNAFARWTDGFLTYSDGAHDDVNKMLWSALGWDSGSDVRKILIEYCRVFFRPDIAETAADGILALERNWQGALELNGGVEATLELWRALESKAPELAGNWRWQMLLMRACYDAYTRARLRLEKRLESEANSVLVQAGQIGADAAADRALETLKRADTEKPRPELRQRVVDLCADMFASVGFQTSVSKYHASGPERGAVLDYLDYPLNNRWWIEDEIAKARSLPEEAKAERLCELGNWETPGPGCFYDDIGNVANSPHVIRGEGLNTDPLMLRNPNPDFMWWDHGMSRVRQTWMSKMDWPIGLRYTGLDPEARYAVRTTGYGQCLLRVNGVPLTPVLDGKDIGEIKEFHVPQALTKNGAITLTFDVPHEPGVNWRVASRLSEVWLIVR